jgi:hypothetical protein
MSFRVTPTFKEKINQAAQESGRSLAQEIEFRLERSLEDRHMAGFRAGVSFALGVSAGPAVSDGINKLNAAAERYGDLEPLKPAFLALIELVQELLTIQDLPPEAFGNAPPDLRNRFPRLSKSLAQFEGALASLDKTSKPARGTRKRRAVTNRAT